MSSDNSHIREQILANARLLIRPSKQRAIDNASQSTLVSSYTGDIDVVIFGSRESYTAAVMVGLTPAIEGESSGSPEGATRKLFMATCELLEKYIPKVGSHQRNIHGGGVFDEDMISAEIVEAQKKNP